MIEEEHFHPSTRDEWRAWLAENHDRATGVWLIFWKTKARLSTLTTLTYEEAVEEALCFGWIDGQLRPVDDERSSIRFSPRRRGSNWARSNKERVARLEAAGLMTEAGRRSVEAARADGSWGALDDIEALVVPDDLAAALATTPGAQDGFDACSASVRKMILAWIAQAKRPATRAERIERVLHTLAAGEPLTSVWQPPG